MNAAILLALLAPAQAPAAPARPDPLAILQRILPHQAQAPVAAPRPIPVERREVQGIRLARQTPQGLRIITLESRPEATPVQDDGMLAPPAPPLPMGGPIDLGGMAVARENFDEWVFTDKREDRDRAAHLQRKLRLRVDEADRARALTPAERRKLELAGSGDIRHFLDHVEQGRAEFERARQDYTAGVRALDAALPLAEEFQDGPFGPGSLLAKTLQKLTGVEPAADDARRRAVPAHGLEADRQILAAALAAGRGPDPADPGGPRVFTAQIEREGNHFFPLTVEPRPDAGAGRPPLGAVAVDDVEIRAENFDLWVVGLGVETPAKRRAFLASLLDRRIDRMSRDRPVPPDLARELRHAGAEDAQRLLDRIAARRAAFERDRRSWDTGLAALRGLEPLAAEFRAGPYGPGSRFAAALEAAGR